MLCFHACAVQAGTCRSAVEQSPILDKNTPTLFCVLFSRQEIKGVYFLIYLAVIKLYNYVPIRTGNMQMALEYVIAKIERMLLSVDAY